MEFEKKITALISCTHNIARIRRYITTHKKKANIELLDKRYHKLGSDILKMLPDGIPNNNWLAYIENNLDEALILESKIELFLEIMRTLEDSYITIMNLIKTQYEPNIIAKIYSNTPKGISIDNYPGSSGAVVIHSNTTRSLELIEAMSHSAYESENTTHKIGRNECNIKNSICTVVERIG
jgi:hypothetical protein